MFRLFFPKKEPIMPVRVVFLLILIAAFSIGGVICLKTADAAQQDKTIFIDNHVICDNMTEIAGIIMECRQHGVEMSRLVTITYEERPKNISLLYGLIEIAYEKPRRELAADKAVEIEEFKCEAYLACMKTFYQLE